MIDPPTSAPVNPPMTLPPWPFDSIKLPSTWIGDAKVATAVPGGVWQMAAFGGSEWMPGPWFP